MNTSRRFRLMLLATLLVAFPATTQATITSFTVHVKARPLQMPAARVLITLELTAPPVGATLSAEGSPAVMVPNIIEPAGPTGDRIAVVNPAATSNVVIELL